MSPERKAPYPDDVLAGLHADAAQIIARYPQPRSALLPLLHLVQSVDGYVAPRGIELCADLLDLTAAEVSGVATFYTQYKRHPNGEYTVGVCTNTLCAIMGGDQIWDSVSDHLGIGHDETTADGKITLERIECNAACDYAPVVMANWEFFDNQTPESTNQLVDDLRAGRASGRPAARQVAPSRRSPGARRVQRRPGRRGHRRRRRLPGRPAARARRGWTTGSGRTERGAPRPTAQTVGAQRAGPRERAGRLRAPHGSTDSPSNEPDEHPADATAASPAPTARRRVGPRERQLTPILTKFWDDPQSWTLATYEKNEGYQALQEGRSACRRPTWCRPGQGLRSARSGRRRASRPA